MRELYNDDVLTGSGGGGGGGGVRGGMCFQQLQLFTVKNGDVRSTQIQSNPQD